MTSMRVCQRHERAFRDGDGCPWCEPEPVSATPHMHAFEDMATMRCSGCGVGMAELYGSVFAEEMRATVESVRRPPAHIVDLRPLAPGYGYDANGSLADNLDALDALFGDE